MALADAVQGARRPSQTITWTDAAGNPLDLTGATITARILRPTGAVASDGTFVVTDAANGVFRWDYSAADVASAGTFMVQFTAAFPSGATPARNTLAEWQVHEAV